MKQRSTHEKKSSCGFSLVELAIVMGVAGIILGGIWAIAANMNQAALEERFADELYTTVNKVRAAYAGKSYVDSTDATVVMGKLGSNGMNVFPATIESPFGAQTNPVANAPATGYSTLYACGWQPKSSTATGSTGCVFSPTAVTNYVPLVAIEALIPAGAYCAEAVMRNSSPASLPGLVDVSINGYTVVATNNGSLPVSLTTAKGNCTPATGNVSVVDFVFRLTPM